MKNLTLVSMLFFCSTYFYSIAQISVTPLIAEMDPIATQVWNLENLELDQILELETISFEADESVITSQSYKGLQALADFMKNNPQLKIEVRGHTNGIPPHQYCNALSEARADGVAKQLLEFGVNESQMTAKGYGKRIPRATNLNSMDRKSNQRVDLKIIAL